MTTYLWDAAKMREKGALARWSVGHANELPGVLGLRRPRGWWCGLFLSRDLLFDRPLDGDVDFIAGPMRYTLAGEEVEERLQAARAIDPRWGDQLCHFEMGREGLVAWPPDVKEVVACEVKASYFDGEWHRTHSKAQAKIMGQMGLLREHGVNRVALLHIGVTRPTEERVNTWTAAQGELGRAVTSFPEVSFSTKFEYGHFQAVMAATHDGLEDSAGAHAGLIVVREPGLVNPIVERSWHSPLRARLDALPRPKGLNTFILEFERCRQWRHSSSPDPLHQPCCCGART